ncbi:YeeE/YedE family protein [Georgenia faecalis]|uniref:YeeE/YedE family protein n=1 Tax=Georgenia faecalis TaxID=2483799 RepID=A0ABV9DCM9_9MICO|nr:YeeE/YedE family protein [Georgenia faecalis]
MVLTGLVVGAALGFALQRGRFCVTGAFRDVWIGRQTRWMTAFLIVIAVQSVGLFALQSLGVIELATGELALAATVVGGFIFGFAIVLAGGCATGTFYRSGEGLIGSWFALLFYAGFSAMMKYGVFAELTAAARAQTVPVTTIHDSLGISPWWLVGALVVGVGALAARHLAAEPRLRIATLPPRRTGLAHLLLEKPWHAFATAVLIGLIAIVAWPLSAASGRNAGLGVTTPSANLVSFLVTGDVALVDWGVFLVLGILVGAFIAAKASGEFRLRVPDATTVVRSVSGGALMGVGASLAGGCTIGNAMVNTAQFSYQGWLSFAFMVLGTGVATHLFILRHRSSAAAGSTPAPVLAGV